MDGRMDGWTGGLKVTAGESLSALEARSRAPSRGPREGSPCLSQLLGPPEILAMSLQSPPASSCHHLSHRSAL